MKYLLSHPLYFITSTLLYYMDQTQANLENSCNICMLTIVAVIAVLLLALKKYFGGGVCLVQKDLTGHVGVITGANTGIGKQTAKALAQLGCDIIFGARDQRKNNKAKQFLEKTAKGKITCFRLDLADQKSIEQFSSKVIETLSGRPINYLINNAGIMALPKREVTHNGFEMQMGVNHLGHFYLTYLLWDHIKKAGSPRIINVSSLAHKERLESSKINFDDINFEKGYGSYLAYSRSKKANILFSKQLQKKMDECKISGISVSLHPGIVNTELDRTFLNPKVKLILASTIGLIVAKNAQQGAQTSIYLVLQREDKLVKGGYYADCNLSPIQSEQCRDAEAAEKLWEVSEKLWGIKFDLE